MEINDMDIKETIREIKERSLELSDLGVNVAVIDWDMATEESLEQKLEGFNLSHNLIRTMIRKYSINKGDGYILLGLNWGELEGIEQQVHEFMTMCNEIGKVKGPWGPLMYCMEDPTQPGAKLSKREGNSGKFTQDFVFIATRPTMERLMTFEKYTNRK
jgi:hypothetical protein